tara:strand:- start:330 stop:497 length:168 start_codon:yes stop_codon:yes gene_type:complete
MFPEVYIIVIILLVVVILFLLPLRLKRTEQGESENGIPVANVEPDGTDSQIEEIS